MAAIKYQQEVSSGEAASSCLSRSTELCAQDRSREPKVFLVDNEASQDSRVEDSLSMFPQMSLVRLGTVTKLTFHLMKGGDRR